MVEAYLRRGPLSHRGLAARAVADAPDADLAIGERPHRCLVNIRGDDADRAFVDAVREAASLALPTAPNSFVEADGVACLWLGPNEWLILGPGGGERDLVPRLRSALSGQHAAVTDVSEARTTLVIAGPKARELLAKGSPLDLHPRVFGPGRCAQTGLVAANIILRQTDDRPTFEVIVLNSFTDYLWQWLERAAAEYRWVLTAAGGGS